MFVVESWSSHQQNRLLIPLSSTAVFISLFNPLTPALFTYYSLHDDVVPRHLNRLIFIITHYQATKSPSEMRDVATRICREYLSGAWKTISADEIEVKRIR